jgi:hypothetical protein
MLHELSKDAEVRQPPALAGKQAEMRASRLLDAAVQKPGSGKIRDHAICMIQGIRFQAGSRQDQGWVGAQLSQQTGNLDQTANPLMTNVARQDRFTDTIADAPRKLTALPALRGVVLDH